MRSAPTKECLVCTQVFHKRVNCSKKEWGKSKYCSNSCRYTGQGIKWSEDKTQHPNWKGGRITIECSTCNKKFMRDKHQEGRAKFCSRECLHESRRGITFSIPSARKSSLMSRKALKDLIRHKITYISWRKAIFERDEYTCQHCEQVGGRLNADHIKPFAQIIDENMIETPEDALMCEELWDLQNGRTLCVKCHRRTPTYGKKYSFVGAETLLIS